MISKQMKLQNKINIRFLIVTFLVFTLAGAAFYIALGKVIDRNIGEILESRRDNVKMFLRQHAVSDSMLVSPDHSITIKPIFSQKKYRKFSDTLLYDEDEKEYVRYRTMTFATSVNGKYYEIAITQSLLESEDLMAVIFYFMVGLFVLVLLALFFLNRWLSASVWKPFFNSLTLLKSFKIGKTRNVQFDKTDIYEFDQLNRTLNNMIQKIQADFINLKEFTENASHEMQTPLTIIQSKLEMALQDKALSTERYHQIRIAYESASRLSKLNEALLLLSKIENQQFIEETDTDLCELTKQRLEFIEELIELKKVKVTVNFHVPVVIKINPYLAEILINNLLNNALKHNLEGGQIVISASDKKITFSNTGTPLTIAPEKLFQRFVKQNAGSESTGLGLAIVSEICKNYKLSLQYDYQNGFHNITLIYIT